MEEISPDLVLKAYALGLFPMAESRYDKNVHWVSPEKRGILPFTGFHVPRSLQKIIRRAPFTLRFNLDFEAVMHACGADRAETWINDPIIHTYTELHRQGYAHCLSVYEGHELVGGIYGLAIGGAFFGESMFAKKPNASRIALVHLAARLHRKGFTLFDAQFVNPHLLQFGCVEIPRAEYLLLLKQALTVRPQSLVSGTGVSAASPPCLLSGDGLASSSGFLSGRFSDENFSSFEEVALFLHSITQTS